MSDGTCRSTFNLISISSSPNSICSTCCSHGMDLSIGRRAQFTEARQQILGGCAALVPQDSVFLGKVANSGEKERVLDPGSPAAKAALRTVPWEKPKGISRDLQTKVRRGFSQNNGTPVLALHNQHHALCKLVKATGYRSAADLKACRTRVLQQSPYRCNA